MTDDGIKGLEAEQLAMPLLAVLRQLHRELQPPQPGDAPRPEDTLPASIGLDSSLEQAWGFDSLARARLLTQLEASFNVALSEQALFSAETPRDLLREILAARKAHGFCVPRGEQPSPAAQLPLADATPEMAHTLPEVLKWHVDHHPERTHLYLYETAERITPLSYGELFEASLQVAASLQHRGLERGQTVALMLPTSRAYFVSFFGVLLAGGVPVPIYPPARPTQIEEHLRRHAGILNNAAVAMLITLAEARLVSRLLKLQVASLRQVITVPEPGNAPSSLPAAAHCTPGEIALLQYTSGSTGDPKGVILTHANLLANIRTMGRAIGVSSNDMFVSWLPLYHDMGLIGAWLGSLYFAVPLVVMSPLLFLARPQRWLWAIHRFRGTLSAAPNFAFDLCLRKLDDSELAGLDLSCWRVAFNGAEPISPETMKGFCERFGRYGFRPEAMAPVYGLAESSVGLAFPPFGRLPPVDRIRREPLMRRGVAMPAAEDDPDALQLVAVGHPLAGHQIRIVDQTGHELPERQEGQLEFKGPSTTRGYYRNPQATGKLFHGDWLDSGDRGYVAGGDVYITGRSKDVIIKAGRNIYPQELEAAVSEIDGVRKGCVAVFAVPDHNTGTEQLVVVAETRLIEADACQRVHQKITRLAVDLLGLPPDDIVLAPPHSVPKTSSGKIRRFASRERYQQHQLEKRPRAIWWQLVRLSLMGLGQQGGRIWRGLREWAYAGYGWLLFALVVPGFWLAVVLSPSTRWARAATRMGARLLLRLSATPVRVAGDAHLKEINNAVLVVNHASYLDSLVLSAALPLTFRFVAKAELSRRPLTRWFLVKLQTEFVERFDVQQGVSDARRLAAEARGGQSLLLFPEGTLSREPGLRPFHLGAFVAAAEAGVPVVPVILRGTRSKLREGSWFLRRGGVSVTVGKPIWPQGSDWQAAVLLRDAARAELLERCGEPDLG